MVNLMKARSTARELALLGISQLSDRPEKNDAMTARAIKVNAASVRRGDGSVSTSRIDALMMKALKALAADASETLDSAAGSLQRGERLMLESETRTVDDSEVRSRIQPAIALIESTINHVGDILELMLFANSQNAKGLIAAQKALSAAAARLEKGDRLLQNFDQKAASITDARAEIASAIKTVLEAIDQLNQALEPAEFAEFIKQSDIRSYASDLFYKWAVHRDKIDERLNEAMEKWTLRRLARVDRDILRLAMIEIIYMDVPKRVAIDEAIEMAKRYSDEDGYRFINGVLRRATDKLEAA